MPISRRARPAHLLADHDALYGDHVANENRIDGNGRAGRHAAGREDETIDADLIETRNGITMPLAPPPLRQPTEAELDAMIADSFPCSDPYY